MSALVPKLNDLFFINYMIYMMYLCSRAKDDDSLM